MSLISVDTRSTENWEKRKSLTVKCAKYAQVGSKSCVVDMQFFLFRRLDSWFKDRWCKFSIIFSYFYNFMLIDCIRMLKFSTNPATGKLRIFTTRAKYAPIKLSKKPLSLQNFRAVLISTLLQYFLHHFISFLQRPKSRRRTEASKT